MNPEGQRLTTSPASCEGDAEAICHFADAIGSGEHWYRALLEAMGLWSSAEERCNERDYRYLIAGEAFDWLLLAERLCQAVDGLLPEAEKNELIFHGRPPQQLTADEVRAALGTSKYHQYLNYFYGIVVEGALVLAVQEEVQKERWLPGSVSEERNSEEAYQRVYGGAKAALWQSFRRETGSSRLNTASLTELKEFTYWLFRYRVQRSEKAKVASDTRKALEYLKRQWARKGPAGMIAAEI
ncbi:MAG: hypothetical protein ABID87_08245 [Chloroflexota bacterium]